MHTIEMKVGKNKIFQMVTKSKDRIIDSKVVKKSWTESLTYKQENKTKKLKGLRLPQLGALLLSLGILKEVDVIKSKAINPVVAMLSTTPSSTEELRDIVNKSNIIVTTIVADKCISK